VGRRAPEEERVKTNTVPLLVFLGAAANASVQFAPHSSILLTSASIIDQSNTLHQNYDQTLGFTPWISTMGSDIAAAGAEVDARLRVETAWMNDRRFTASIDAASEVRTAGAEGVRSAQGISFAAINAGFTLDAPTSVTIDVVNEWTTPDAQAPRVELVFYRDDGLSVIADWRTYGDATPFSAAADLDAGLWHLGWSLEIDVREGRPFLGDTEQSARSMIDVRFVPAPPGVLALTPLGLLAARRRR